MCWCVGMIVEEDKEDEDEEDLENEVIRKGGGRSERREEKDAVVVADERQEVCECRPVQQVRSTLLGVRSGQDNTKILTLHEFSPGLVKHPPLLTPRGHWVLSSPLNLSHLLP